MNECHRKGFWSSRGLSLQALLELESSASSDEAVRKRIASLPPEVSEVQLLSKLEGKKRLGVLIGLTLYLRNLRQELALLELARRAGPCTCNCARQPCVRHHGTS